MQIAGSRSQTEQPDQAEFDLGRLPARRVLAVGTDDWAIEQSAAMLTNAGHEVMRCHEPNEPVFPCNALRPGGRCPLDTGTDLVVTSRARPTDQPTPSEMGVVCALRAGVPLVVTGISRRSPFNDLALAVLGEHDDLAAVVEGIEPAPTRIALPESS